MAQFHPHSFEQVLLVHLLFDFLFDSDSLLDLDWVSDSDFDLDSDLDLGEED
jgi:hypothetical protein